ncbi:MAG: hypothetical protein JXB34_04705 [Bacteroidales bacterium]|nr:hypothetical protein [Bacteroidales bacterium]
MTDILAVCHGGRLEPECSFLAWSIKKYVRGDYTFHIAIPEPSKHILPVKKQTLCILEKLGCQVFYFKNEFVEKRESLVKGDLTSNKLFALGKHFKGSHVVFLDSDTVFTREIEIHKLIKGHPLQAVVAKRNDSVKWAALFKYFFPEKCENKVPEFLNAGVLVFENKFLENILKEWESVFSQLSNKLLINKKLYPVFFRDQIALSLALQAKKIETGFLCPEYNYTKILLPNKKKMPVIMHYHHPAVICINFFLRRQFDEFAASCLPDNNNLPLAWKILASKGIIAKGILVVQYIYRVIISRIRKEICPYWFNRSVL